MCVCVIVVTRLLPFYVVALPKMEVCAKNWLPIQQQKSSMSEPLILILYFSFLILKSLIFYLARRTHTPFLCKGLLLQLPINKLEPRGLLTFFPSSFPRAFALPLSLTFPLLGTCHWCHPVKYLFPIYYH